MSHHYVCVFNS